MGNPEFICMDKMERGKFSHVEPGSTAGFVNVYYYKKYFWILTKLECIQDVPERITKAPILRPDNRDYPDGIFVITRGSLGHSMCLSAMKEFEDRNWADIQSSLRAKDMNLKGKEHELQTMRKGIKQNLADLKDSSDILDKGSKKHRASEESSWGE